MEIPIYSSIIKTSNNVVSYQMRVNYDASMLEYTDFSLNNTIAKGGAITINNSIQGALIISYMGTTPLNGMGPIIKLIFEPQQLGKSDIMIFDCLYNVDTIPKLKNGSITIDGIYGDIDQNNAVQAFDASAVLQYSVGLDPLDFDEIPWDPWRIVLANVDGREGVSANDASLILQYSSGSISTYPIEAIHQIDQSFADVLVRQTNNELVFSSTGKLYGLNVKMISVENLELGLPIMSYENMLSTTNIQGETYNIGLCSATPLQDNTTIMKIPFKMTGHSEASAEIEMIVNRNATSKIMIFFLKNQ